MLWATTGRSFASGPAVTGFSKTTWRVSAPIASGVALVADAGNPGDVVDVDQDRRTRQAEIHRRHQALAARQHPRVPAMLGEKRGRFLDRARREIFEGRWFHANGA